MTEDSEAWCLYEKAKAQDGSKEMPDPDEFCREAPKHIKD